MIRRKEKRKFHSSYHKGDLVESENVAVLNFADFPLYLLFYSRPIHFGFFVFGDSPSTYPARMVNRPHWATIRVGDIIRINGNSHSAVVVARDDKVFTLSEGNRGGNGVVEWGRTIPVTSYIDYVITRWP